MFMKYFFIFLFFITMTANGYCSWYNSTYEYKHEFLITNNEDVDEVEMTIPIYIDDSIFLNNTFDWVNQENAVRFTWINESGLEQNISYWVEWWDDINNRAQLWIQLPNFYRSSDNHFGFGAGEHKIFLYYGNTTVTSSLSNKRNTFLIFDSMDSAPTGNFYGSATYIAPVSPNPGYARITQAVGSQYGGMYYSISFAQGIAGEFDFWTGGGSGADSVWLGVHNNLHPTAEDIVRGGYHFTFDEYQSRIAFTKSVNDNGGSLAQVYHPSIDDSTWRHVDIEYLNYGGTARGISYLDNVLIIDYTDGSPQATTGTLFGFYGRTGGSTNEHRIRGLTLRKILWNMPTVSSVQGHTKPKLILTIEPSLSTIFLIKGLFTKINATITCSDTSGNSCSNVTLDLEYNDTSSSYAQVPMSSSFPMWTNNSLLLSSIIPSGGNKSFILYLNATGEHEDLNMLRFRINSNNSLYSEILKLQLAKTVNRTVITFNETLINYTGYKDNTSSGNHNVKLKSFFGDNSNVQLSCISGFCSKFTHNFVNGIGIVKDDEEEFTINCNTSAIANYYARFQATSDESGIISYLDVYCKVEPLSDTMVGELLYPVPYTIFSIKQNTTRELQSKVRCIGECSTINAYAILYDSSWWDSSFLYRQKLTIDINDAIPANYSILIRYNDTIDGPSFDWNRECRDIRLVYSGTLLDHWVEKCDSGSKEAGISVRMPNAMSAGSSFDLEMYYGNPSSADISNPSSVFNENSVYLVTGDCPNTDAGCNPMDSNSDADRIRQYINSGGWGIHGQGVQTYIDDTSNPYGASTNYYSRYRTLFIPTLTMSYSFATASSEGSEIGTWDYDGYGYGLSTPSAISDHSVIASWYGSHASAPCGSVGTKSTISLTRGDGYWLDYVQQDRTNANTAQMCIRTIGLFEMANTANFPGQFFSRSYVENEPSVNTWNAEEDSLVPSVNLNTLYTIDGQPQSCTPGYGGECYFNWSINATGPELSQYNVSVVYVSSNSGIASDVTPYTTFEIVLSQVPIIILYYPYDNFKSIGNLTTSFKWAIDDDTSNNCSLFIDGIERYNGTCLPLTNTTVNLTLTPGEHDWYVYTIDYDANTVNSIVRNIYSILYRSAFIIKRVASENTNMYKQNITLTSLTFNDALYFIIDFVANGFISGSFSPSLSFTNTTSDGEYVGWNTTMSNSSGEIDFVYSDAAIGNYKFRNNFIISLE